MVDVKDVSRLIDVLCFTGFVRNTVKQLKSYASDKDLEIVARFFARFSVTSGFLHQQSAATTEEFYVIKNAARCLMSRKSAERHGVLILGQEARDLIELKERYDNRFKIKKASTTREHQVNTEEVEEFPAFAMKPVRIRLKEDVPPTKVRYTNIPFNMRNEAQGLIEEMVSMRVIEEVTDYSSIDWISSMLAVVKPNGKLRLVVDLRGPNKAVIREACPMPTFETVLFELPECRFFSTIDLTNAFMSRYTNSRDT